MSKKKKQPKAGTPYPGSERFSDWDLGGIIPLEPGQVLVNDDPEGDPHKFPEIYHRPPEPPARRS